MLDKGVATRNPECRVESTFKHLKDEIHPNTKPETAMKIRTSVDGCRSFVGSVDECVGGFVKHHSKHYPTRDRIIIRRRKTTKRPTFSKSIDTELRRLKNKSAKDKKLLNEVQKEKFQFDLTKHMESLNLSNNSDGFIKKSSSNNNDNYNFTNPTKQRSIISFCSTGGTRSTKKRKSNKKNNSNTSKGKNNSNASDRVNNMHENDNNERKNDEPTRCQRKMSENTCFLNTCCQFLGNVPGFGDSCIKHNDKSDDGNLQAWRQQNEKQIREHPICYSSKHNIIRSAINACAVGNKTIDLSDIMNNIESYTPQMVMDIIYEMVDNVILENVYQ